MDEQLKSLKKEIYNLPIDLQKKLLTTFTDGHKLTNKINDKKYSQIEEQILNLTPKDKTKIFNSLSYRLIQQPENEDPNNYLMEKVFALIKDCMTSKNISERQLEKEMDITQSSIYAWRIGKAKPSLDALIKIANYFNVSLDYLAGRETQRQGESKQAITGQNTASDATTAPLLSRWVQLNKSQQQKVLTYIDDITGQNNNPDPVEIAYDQGDAEGVRLAKEVRPGKKKIL